MKKLMMIAVMMLMSMGAFAQEAGKMAVGATLTDYLDSKSRIAIGGKFQYSINETFRAEADLKFYPPNNHVTIFNPTVNLHYLIPIIDKLYVYPLAGVGLWGYSFNPEHGDSDFDAILTVKAGAGAEYYITDQIKGLFETYYQIAKKGDIKNSKPVVSIGAAYCF